MKTVGDIVMEMFENQKVMMKQQEAILHLLQILLSSKNEEKQVVAPKITMEAVNTLPVQPSNLDMTKNVMVNADVNLTVDNSPQGFRRTSRPETFTADKSSPREEEATIKMPIQVPRSTGGSEIVAPKDSKEELKQQKVDRSNSFIPVQQKVLDAKGKSLFLVDIEVTDLSNNKVVHKTRTKPTGKWDGSLPVGEYQVTMKRVIDNTNIPKSHYIKVSIDGSSSKVQLPDYIFK